MSDRVEAAAKAVWDGELRQIDPDPGQVAREALIAADEADRENGIVRVDTRDDATVEKVALVMAEHHRLDPMSPYDRCTCGHKTPLGKLYSAHIARDVIAALMATP